MLLLSRITLIMILVGATNPVWSQKKFSYEGTYHRGYLVAHRPLIEGLRQERVSGYELSIIRRLSGKQDWHLAYDIPKAGVYFGVWNLGNKDFIGNSYSIIPFMEIKIVDLGTTRLGLKFGWGVGYLENRFDPETNYKNLAIGTRLNNAIVLHPSLDFKLAKRNSVRLGFSLSHYSNGSFETPNLGINIAAFTLGFAFNSRSDSVAKRTMAPFEPERKDFVFGSVFAKEVAPAEGSKYAVATLFAERMWRISRKFSFGGGVDVFFDQSLSQRINYDQSIGTMGLFRSGLHAGSELHFGNTYLIMSIGAYFYSGVRSESVYNRFGIRQNLNKKWTACIHIKSHWGKADYMEIGIGRTFTKK